MNLINDWLSLTLLVDGVIAFTLLEALLLAAHHRVTGKGVALHDFGFNMLSGLCLMLALRAGLHDQGSGWVCLCLLLAGLAHAVDIGLRWRRKAVPARAAGRSRRRTKPGDVHLATRAEVHS